MSLICLLMSGRALVAMASEARVGSSLLAYVEGTSW